MKKQIVDGMFFVILSYSILCIIIYSGIIKSDFIKRKLLHGGLGAILIYFENELDLHTAIFVVILSVPFLGMLFQKNNFVSSNKLGIISYAYIVIILFVNNIPFSIFTPLLLGDPLAALFGHFFGRHRLLGSKTLEGTFIFFSISFGYSRSITYSILLSIVELVSGAYDNFTLSMSILLYYVLYTFSMV